MTTMVCFFLMLNFSFIGLLPVIFFKREGKLNFKWWLTAWPFFVGGFTMFLAVIELLHPMVEVPLAALYTSATLAILSVGMMGYAMGSNRVSLSLWHQANDKPQAIVTVGAYKRIRHPFYTSFLICLMASVLAFPHIITFICLIYSLGILTWTAKGEEERLSQSAFGREYQDYMKQTGRFFPKL